MYNKVAMKKEKRKEEMHMKKPVLVIGSTCVDVIINIDHLPVTEENIRPTGQSFALGGCAFNAANILRQSGAEFTFVSPVGGGVYGDYVKKSMEEKGFEIRVRVPEEKNGCCYCLVEAGGERTFMSYHGVEYSFRKEWMKGLSAEDYSMVYVCGMEIEERTGGELVSWLEENPGPEIFFAPGPRAAHLKKEWVDRLYALHPVLHINEAESRILSGCNDMKEAAEELRRKTGNAVVITMGADGVYCLKKDGTVCAAPGVPAHVVDTIGAGDSHIGALMACLYRDMSMEEALEKANRVSSAVVSVKGASVSDEEFLQLGLCR